MFTMEQKVDLVLRYIATTDKTQRAELKKAIVEALKSDEATAPCSNGPDIEYVIIDILKDLGMPPHLIGHGYTIYAIQLVTSDRTYLEQITSRLYPDIAAKFGTTPSRVERAIRHATETVFDRGDMEGITRIFGNTISIRKGKLTNSEMIASCVIEVTRRLRESNTAAV